MTTRRRFIFGTFVLGCALALGLKPKRPQIGCGECNYLRTEPFKLRGIDGNYTSVPESVYFEAKDDLDWLIVPRNGRLQVIDLGQSEK